MDHFNTLKTQFNEWCSQKSIIGFDQLFMSATFKSLRGLNVFEGAIDALEVSDQITIGFLVGCGTQWGASLCESIDPEILKSSLNAALVASRFADNEPDFTLAKPDKLPGEGEAENRVHDKNILSLSIQQLEETALFLESEAKKKSPAIFNVPHAACGYDTTETIVLNSEGVGVCEENVLFKASLSCAARGEDGRVVNVSDFVVYSQLSDFQASRLVEEVAGETIKRLNSQKVSSGRYLVCFDKQMSSHLLSNFHSVFSGDLLYKHMTKLEGKLGQLIASPLVDLVDSPAIGLVTHSYDAEGVASSKKNLISKGILNSFLHNQYTAKKTGARTTGNADGGCGALPGVSPTNLFWDGLTTPEADILQKISRGIYITELSGASASPISGDFSYGAQGYWVEDGEKKYPVADFTVAGNFFEILKNIVGIGDELRFVSPHRLGSFGGRLLLVEGLEISG